MKIKDLCSKYKLTNYACNKLKFKLGIVKNKTKQTCLEKYGYEHPFQNSEIMEKSIKQNYKKLRRLFNSCNYKKSTMENNYNLVILINNFTMK